MDMLNLRRNNDWENYDWSDPLKSITIILRTILLLTILSVPLASAQVDPDPDGIGIYFDLEASVVAATATTGEVVQAFLIGTNLSQAGNIDYWETRLCPGPGAAIYGSPRGSFNYATNMPGDPCWSCVALYSEPPLPAQVVTILADLEIEILDGTASIDLFVLGEDRYRMDGAATEFPLYPSSGSAEMPVAVINGDVPVDVEEGAWGQVKAMYR